MAYSPDYRTYAPGATANAAVLDAGLRSYMLNVYNWMASGLLLTGVVSFAVANTSLINLFYPLVKTPYGMRHTQGPLAIVAMLAPLAFVLVLSFGVNRLSKTAVQAIFWAFCAAMGASLTSIFLAYTGDSIVRTFFVTAGTFGAMSIVGYTTKRDLSRMGSFLIMGLFGIIIASVVNMFIHSSGMQFHHQHHRRAGVRRPDCLRHAADQGDLPAIRPCRGSGSGGQAQRLRRAEPVFELYQPVHASPATHRQPPAVAAARLTIAEGSRFEPGPLFRL